MNLTLNACSMDLSRFVYCPVENNLPFISLQQSQYIIGLAIITTKISPYFEIKLLNPRTNLK